MVISVNTEKMNELSNLAMNISSELSEACSCLSPVTIHNDWNCVERDNINEAIMINKKCVGELMSCAENISSVVAKTADSFTEFEMKNPQALLGLHSTLSESLAIYTPSSGMGRIVGPGGKMPRPADLPTFSHAGEKPFIVYPIHMWDKPIRIIDMHNKSN